MQCILFVIQDLFMIDLYSKICVLTIVFASIHLVVCQIVLNKGQLSFIVEFVHFSILKIILNAISLNTGDKLRTNDPKATAHAILHL